MMTNVDIVRFNRMKKKITISEIAREINCSAALINRYEHTGSGMSPENIKLYNEFIENTPARGMYKNMARSKTIV